MRFWQESLSQNIIMRGKEVGEGESRRSKIERGVCMGWGRGAEEDNKPEDYMLLEWFEHYKLILDEELIPLSQLPADATHAEDSCLCQVH